MASMDGFSLSSISKLASPKLKMMDYSIFDSFGGHDREFTKEELFRALWGRIVDQLEGR